MELTLNTSDCSGRSLVPVHGIITNTFPWKSIFSLIFLLALFFYTNAQLKVDAGNDIIVCSEGVEEYRIGGCPVASGGIEPYTYTWSGKRKRLPNSNYWIFASDILDDTTKSNPSFRWNKVPSEIGRASCRETV